MNPTTSPMRTLLRESDAWQEMIPNARLVQAGNATLRNKHFYDAWKDPKYTKVRINWKQAVKERYGPEGKRPLTKEFIQGEKRELPPSHFKSMYECEFPEEDEDSLMAWKYIQLADQADLESVDLTRRPYILYGFDVAREGEITQF